MAHVLEALPVTAGARCKHTAVKQYERSMAWAESQRKEGTAPGRRAVPAKLTRMTAFPI